MADSLKFTEDHLWIRSKAGAHKSASPNMLRMNSER